jgi:hypothetical protein
MVYKEIMGLVYGDDMKTFLFSFVSLIVFSGPCAVVFATNSDVSITPTSSYAEELMSEIGRVCTSNTKRINLQNNPLIFASKKQLFDQELATKLIKELGEKAPNLEILDLSLNQLPENALISFAGLLKNQKFRYLDVTINRGADSMDGIKLLAETLGEDGRTPAEDRVNILKKVIWLPETFLKGQIQDQIPDVYIKAHEAYYNEKRLKPISGPPLPS